MDRYGPTILSSSARFNPHSGTWAVSNVSMAPKDASRMSGKLGCVVRMVVGSITGIVYRPMRNAGQMTIGKTHPRLPTLDKTYSLFVPEFP